MTTTPHSKLCDHAIALPTSDGEMRHVSILCEKRLRYGVGREELKKKCPIKYAHLQKCTTRPLPCHCSSGIKNIASFGTPNVFANPARSVHQTLFVRTGPRIPNTLASSNRLTALHRVLLVLVRATDHPAGDLGRGRTWGGGAWARPRYVMRPGLTGKGSRE